MSDSKAKLPPMPPPVSSAPPSSIPTGPSPSRKDMTAGWNDPPKTLQTGDSNNPLRREKKAKKTSLSPPASLPAFSPNNN